MNAPTSRPGGLAQRALRATTWSLGSAVLRLLARVAMMVILARLLTPVEFGVFAAAMIAVGLTNSVAEFGLGAAIVQRQDLDESHVAGAFGTALAVGAVCTVSLAATAPLIGEVMNLPRAVLPMRVLSLIFLFRPAAALSECLLHRALKLRGVAIARLATYVAGSVPVSITLALNGGGEWSLVGGHLVATVVEAAIVLRLAPLPRPRLPTRRTLGQLMSFAGPFTMARLINYVAQRGDGFVVSRWLGASAMGFYSRAYQLMALPAMLFAQSVDTSFFSTLSRIQSNRGRVKQAYLRGMGATALVVLPAGAWLVVSCREIVQVVLGSDWGPVVGPLRILVTGMFFRIGYEVSGAVVRACGAVRWVAVSNGLYAVATLTLGWLGSRHGVSAVAAAAVAALLLHFAFLTAVASKLASVRVRDWLSCLGPALASATIAMLTSEVIANACRQTRVHPIGTLAATVVGTAVVLGACAWRLPRLVVGPHGHYWLGKLRRSGAARG